MKRRYFEKKRVTATVLAAGLLLGSMMQSAYPGRAQEEQIVYAAPEMYAGAEEAGAACAAQEIYTAQEMYADVAAEDDVVHTKNRLTGDGQAAEKEEAGEVPETVSGTGMDVSADIGADISAGSDVAENEDTNTETGTGEKAGADSDASGNAGTETDTGAGSGSDVSENADANAGTEADTGAGSDASENADANAGTEAGTGLGSDVSENVDANAGTEADTSVGSDVSGNADANAGTEADTGAGSDASENADASAGTDAAAGHSARSVLEAEKENVHLYAVRASGEDFPEGTQLQLLSLEEATEGYKDAQKLRERYRVQMQAAWKIPEERILLFLPYYIELTDSLGNPLPKEALQLTFELRDSEAMQRESQGTAKCRIGHHAAEQPEILLEDVEQLSAELYAERETVQLRVEIYQGGWYSLVQIDAEEESGFEAESDAEEESSSEAVGDAEPESEELQSEPADASSETGTVQKRLLMAAQRTLPDNVGIEDGNPAWAPEVLRAGKASTHKRKVNFQTADRTVTKWAYCLEPLKGNPGEDIYDISQAVVLDSGTVNLQLAKTLYYLYGGPAWGKSVNGVNLKNVMTDAGCTTSDNYYAMTHYVLAYFYNNGNEALWNAHPEEVGVLNSKGISLVKTLAGSVAQLPNPYVKLSSTSVTSSFRDSDCRFVSQPVTYQTFPENTATAALPAGVTLFNHTTGASATGSAVLRGGDTFHLEASPNVSGSGRVALTCSMPTDFIAFKKSFSGDAQDLGFSYFSGERSLSLSVTWPARGRLNLKKTSRLTAITNGNRAYTLAGAEFAVYSDANAAVQVGTLTTDAAGNSNTLTLPPGRYYVRETAAPQGYLLSYETKEIMVYPEEASTVQAADTPITHTIEKLLKKAVDGNTNLSMKDAHFTVKFYGGDTPSGTPLRVWQLKTDESGALRLDGTLKVGGDAFYTDASGKICLPLGCLTFTETQAPAGCQLRTDTIVNLVKQDGIHGADGALLQQPVSFTDEPAFIGVRIRKADAEKETGAQGDGTLAGAVFAVISCNDYTVVTQSNHSKAFQKGEEVLRLVTDAHGIAQTGAELQAGAYRICEVTAPEGYLKNDEKTLSFQSLQHGTIVDLTQDAVADSVMRGAFSVEKWDVEQNTPGLAQGDAQLSGAKFSLVNRSVNAVLVDADQDGTYESYAPHTEIMQFTTDENGRYDSPDGLLPYGTYALTETDPPDGYTAEGENLSRLFEVRENGQRTELTTDDTATKNRVIRGDLTICKFRDTLSGQERGDDVQPIPGVVFEIRLKKTDELVCTLTTDEDGCATTMDREKWPDGRLPYGRYVITETEHPEDVEPVQPFEVFIGLDQNGNEIDHFHYKGIYKNDRPIEAMITLVKKDAESGKVIPAAGTEFQILNEKKEVLTFRSFYPHKEELTSFVTDDSGTVNLPEKLPYGTYFIREVQAPHGYLRGEDLRFEVKTSGTWEAPLILEYSDALAKGAVRLEKQDAETKKALAGAVFALFAGEDIVTGDRTLHYGTGSLIETLKTDEKGRAESGKLYPGRYYLQEIQAPQGYCLDPARYYSEITYADQETPVVYTQAACGNRPTTLKLKKTDPDGKALPGVAFVIEKQEKAGAWEEKRLEYEEIRDTSKAEEENEEIRNTEEQSTEERTAEERTTGGRTTEDRTTEDRTAEERTEGERSAEGRTAEDRDAERPNIEERIADTPNVEKQITDADGCIILQYLLPGVYTVREVKTLSGYHLDETPQYVTVDENGRIFESDANGAMLDTDRKASDTVTLQWVNTRVPKEPEPPQETEPETQTEEEMQQETESETETGTEPETEPETEREKKGEGSVPLMGGSAPKTGQEEDPMVYFLLAAAALGVFLGIVFYKKIRYTGKQ